MLVKNVLMSAAAVAVLTMSFAKTYAHVTVHPKQSATGVTETYTMQVPTEKPIPTVRVEVEFPASLQVSAFEAKQGWTIDRKEDAAGKLVSVVLRGSIPAEQSESFRFTARNPAEAGTLTWKVIQVYADESKVEWSGVAGSKTPSPAVELKKLAAGSVK
jgi:uncharacterized protein YcnI